MSVTPHPLRQKGVWIWVVVLLPIFIAGLVLVHAVDSYSPLIQGDTAQGPNGAVQQKDPFGHVEDPPKLDIVYRDGAENSFAFTIRNSGRWGVTILDLPILHRGSFRGLFTVIRAEIGGAERIDGPFTRFRSFSLPAGHERMIRLFGVSTYCEWYLPGGSTGFGSIDVTYRYMWSSKTATIGLPWELAFTSPPKDGCPRPTQTQG